MSLNTRAATAIALSQVLAGKSLNQVLPQILARVAQRDRGLLQQLCYGTLRHYPRLRGFLNLLLEKPLKNRDRDLQALLLSGIYQLEETRVPDHAAVAETVNALIALKKPWSKGLVNAVLRRFLRERDELAKSLDEAELASHPRWMLQKIKRQWPAEALAIIEANNTQPPMTLRVNPSQANRDGYIEELRQSGIAAQPCAISAQALRLEHPVDVSDLPGFAEGMASVQDEAAQLAALLLGAAPGDRILDACAAPGGKTCHILEVQPGVAELVALDVDEQRLTKVADNLQRLRLSATLMTANAAAPPTTLDTASFDRILVDAPCSASGVIRRHPDIKYLRREQDIANFAALQISILNGIWPLLKVGGCLLYATCSIFDEENSNVIAAFLSSQEDAQLQKTDLQWGEATACGRQLLPTTSGPDGLFYALLVKTA
ncbi:MAG: 16S rRNA (cytosine(967)-C(5))-methyltransferase RsmB [Halieaceae bacterium]|jgi:16S rRNA (cytosine967-C5)-methyltransferase|nr:16S rRNA (cytosine(967)-C(5))-methyltransferase RsmB [Halieaceae bacterium]